MIRNAFGGVTFLHSAYHTNYVGKMLTAISQLGFFEV